MPTGAPIFPLKKTKDLRERTLMTPPAAHDAVTTEMGVEPDTKPATNSDNEDDQPQVNIADSILTGKS